MDNIRSVFVAIETCDVGCCEGVASVYDDTGMLVASEASDVCCSIEVGFMNDDTGLVFAFEACNVIRCDAVGCKG